MARLNGKRRRAAAQRRAATLFANALNPSSQASTGHVRNAHKVHIAAQVVPSVARAYSPRPPNWEAPGRVGKVVKGKLVPKPKPRPTLDTRALTDTELKRAQFAGGRKAPRSQSLPTEEID